MATGLAEGYHPFTSKFDELVAQAFDSWKFLGLSIGVTSGSQDFTKGYGIANLPDTPVTPETLFYAGSTTKAFCAAAVSLLVDDDEKHKNIQWDTPISQLIRDDFVLRDFYWNDHITLEDALSHRTGFPSHNKCCVGTGSSVREDVRKLRHLPSSREPRTVSQYCNIMYVVVSHAIEVVTEEYLGDFLARRIWQPLGITSTYFSLDEAKKSAKPFAQGYYWDKEIQEHAIVLYLDLSEVSGGGCNTSTVLDYLKWLRAMIHRDGPISPKGHEALTKPLIAYDYGYPPAFPTVFYGLGWMMLYYRGEKVIFHPGGIIGFSAMVAYLPQRAWGCVMMSNSNDAAPALDKLMWYLIDELLGVPVTDRVDWDDWSKQQQRAAESHAATARSRIYPHAASIPPSLPLLAYTGTYTHPAYPPLHLTLENKTIRAVVNRPWPFATVFEHVSGEYFLACTSKFAVEIDEVAAAEFTVNAQGEAERLRVRFEEGADMVEFVKG